MKHLILSLVLISSLVANSQNLKRQAKWEFEVKTSPEEKITVKSIAPGSSTAKAGLKENDLIISINGQLINSNTSFVQAKKKIKAGEEVSIKIKREGKEKTISFKSPAKPFESMEGVEIINGEARSSYGYYVQTISTKPKSTPAGRKLPGIFFVGWLTCDPVEINPNSMDGWALLIQDFATKSGMAFMRVEKPGVGDSQGPDCQSCDLNQDMAAYRTAFKEFKKLDFVDSSQIFVFGGSIGGALAPVLMQNENLKGIIVANTFGRTWYEHFLDFERTRLEFAGKSFSEINQSMKLFAEFYGDYLLHNKTPRDVISAKPHLKDLWYDGPESQFGRPSVYHHQVQQLNVPAAWQKINFPVLVIYGEYDWIMSRQEHEYIAHVVNSSHPGSAELKIIPQMDHHFSIYKTPKEAFEGNYINYSQDVFPSIQNWIKSKVTNN